MNYYSLQDKLHIVSFKEAAIRGQAPDKGLYFPEKIPVLEKAFVREIEKITDEEIAFRVIKPFVGDDIPDDVLFDIVKETINFPIPLQSITPNISVLELFHGPTLAFKDVGARFMSRGLGYFLKNEQRTVTVLVATSGDTGGAVANGFYNVDGINVVILYPKNRVSPVQEKQLTSLGKNITALEVEGGFDDCQQIVKQLFADEEINKKIWLTSANSINVARWLPQQFYYFFAYKQWKEKDVSPVVCVPSGNFGNICAGLLSKATGLPLGHFIAACNVNDIVTRYLQTQQLQPKETVPTLSNAMDVGNPSNFIRILEIFNDQFSILKENLSSCTVNDEETMQTIKNVYDNTGYILDPHGAVAYYALEAYLNINPHQKGFILETAHPVKFPQAVEGAIQKKIDVPAALHTLMKQPKNTITVKPEFKIIKDFLLSNMQNNR